MKLFSFALVTGVVVGFSVGCSTDDSGLARQDGSTKPDSSSGSGGRQGSGGTTGSGGSVEPGTGGSGSGGTVDPSGTGGVTGTGGSTGTGTGGTTGTGTGGTTGTGTGGSTGTGTGGSTGTGTGGSTGTGTGGRSGSGGAGSGGHTGSGGHKGTGGTAGGAGQKGTGGAAGQGGTGGKGSGGAGGQTICGGLAGFQCRGADEFCELKPGVCLRIADATGTCTKKPTACNKDCPRVCGCNGHTYCNDCERQVAGVSKAYDGECKDPPAACDPRTVNCGPKQFCELPDGQCLSGIVGTPKGMCVPQPLICQDIYLPVCGCDGKTYGNDCARQAAGVSKAYDHACRR